MERRWLVTGEVALPQPTSGLALPALLHGADLYGRCDYCTVNWKCAFQWHCGPMWAPVSKRCHQGVWEALDSKQPSQLGAWLLALVTVHTLTRLALCPAICPVTEGLCPPKGKFEWPKTQV